MKRYEVILEPRAEADLDAAYRWIARDSKRAADLWYRGCLSSIRTLEEFPGRCPLAPEDEVFKAEIRQLLYGRGSKPYRILFTLGNGRVHVLHIRHGAQERLEEGD